MILKIAIGESFKLLRGYSVHGCSAEQGICNAYIKGGGVIMKKALFLLLLWAAISVLPPVVLAVDEEFIKIENTHGQALSEDIYAQIFLKMKKNVSATKPSILAAVERFASRFFAPKTTGFILTATFTVNGKKLPPIPFYAAERDEGAKSWKTAEQDDVYVTPPFPLDTSNPDIPCEIQALFTEKRDVKVIDKVSQVMNVVGLFQPQLGVVKILTGRAFEETGKKVENIIGSELSSKGESTKGSQFSVFKGEGLTVKVNLSEKESLVFDFTLKTRQTLLSLSDRKPYKFSDDGVAVLAKKYGPSGQSLRDYIIGNEELKRDFYDTNEGAKAINRFCENTDAYLAQDIGFNKLDRAVVLHSLLQSHDWWKFFNFRYRQGDDVCENKTAFLKNETNLKVPERKDLFRKPDRSKDITDREKVFFVLARGLKSNNKADIAACLMDNITVFVDENIPELQNIYQKAPDFVNEEMAVLLAEVKFTTVGNNAYDTNNINLVRVKNVVINKSTKVNFELVFSLDAFNAPKIQILKIFLSEA